MENEAQHRCWRCGFVCSHPGALANHLRACDLKGQKERHEKSATEARLQQQADELAVQVEEDRTSDVGNELARSCLNEVEDTELEKEISAILSEQNKRARVEGAAVALCGGWCYVY